MKKLASASSFLFLLAILSFAAAPAAVGQSREGLLEIDPLVGYSTWGRVEEGFENGSYRLDLAERAGYGLRVGYGLTDTFQVELEVSRTETELLIEQFGFPSASFHDLTLQSVLAYGTYHFTRSRIAPYVTFGAGAAHLESAVNILCPRGQICIASIDRFVPHQETRPAIAAGVGVKVSVADHLGLRLDARGHAVSQGDTTFIRSNVTLGARKDWLTSGTISTGLLFTF